MMSLQQQTFELYKLKQMKMKSIEVQVELPNLNLSHNILQSSLKWQ